MARVRRILSREEIAPAAPYGAPAAGTDPRAFARARMEATGRWHPRQSMERRATPVDLPRPWETFQQRAVQRCPDLAVLLVPQSPPENLPHGKHQMSGTDDNLPPLREN